MITSNFQLLSCLSRADFFAISLFRPAERQPDDKPALKRANISNGSTPERKGQDVNI
jgi:hypothetical protein